MEYYLLAQTVYGAHLEAIAFVSCQEPEERQVKHFQRYKNIYGNTQHGQKIR